MRGGLIIALIVSAIVAFGFYSAAQSFTQKLARDWPASGEARRLAFPASGGDKLGTTSHLVGQLKRQSTLRLSRVWDGEAV